MIPYDSSEKFLKTAEEMTWSIPNEKKAIGSFFQLSMGIAAPYEIKKKHKSSSEDWCILADFNKNDYI